MTEHTYFTCDVCGEKFIDKYECEQHEQEHRVNKLNGRIRFFKENENKMVELPVNSDGIGKVEFIYCADAEAWEILQDIFEDGGYCSPSDYCVYDGQFYAYDDSNYAWYNVMKSLDYYSKILHSMNSLIEGK